MSYTVGKYFSSIQCCVIQCFDPVIMASPKRKIWNKLFFFYSKGSSDSTGTGKMTFIDSECL